MLLSLNKELEIWLKLLKNQLKQVMTKKENQKTLIQEEEP